jgi:hypothetical protein
MDKPEMMHLARFPAIGDAEVVDQKPEWIQKGGRNKFS